MKIAYFQGPFPRLCEAYLLEQVKALTVAGHRVQIIASHRADHPKQHADVQRLGLLESTWFMDLPEQRWRQVLSALWLVLRNFWHMPRPLLRALNFSGYDCPSLDIYLRAIHGTVLLGRHGNTRYDAIHCHLGYVASTAVALRQIGVLEGPIISTFASADIYVYPKRFRRNCYAGLWTHGELNLAHTDYVADVIRALGAREETISILPLGVDVAKFRFRERSLSPGERIELLTVARLVPKKGLDYAIRAVAEVYRARPGLALRYRIAGDGPLRTALTELIGQLGMEDRIVLLGWQDHDEVTRLFAEAHLFVLPSVTTDDGNKESQGVVLQEAQACGLPVVVTDHNGFPEGMLDGRSGYLVPERDWAALAQRIGHLVDRPDFWPTFGRAGRAFVENKYEISAVNAAFARICADLAAGRPVPRGHVRAAYAATSDEPTTSLDSTSIHNHRGLTVTRNGQ
jgi:colanic acid/amylovoran biosynthesis glycosyltransferase